MVNPTVRSQCTKQGVFWLQLPNWAARMVVRIDLCAFELMKTAMDAGRDDPGKP